MSSGTSSLVSDQAAGDRGTTAHHLAQMSLLPEASSSRRSRSFMELSLLYFSSAACNYLRISCVNKRQTGGYISLFKVSASSSFPLWNSVSNIPTSPYAQLRSLTVTESSDSYRNCGRRCKEWKHRGQSHYRHASSFMLSYYHCVQCGDDKSGWR